MPHGAEHQNHYASAPQPGTYLPPALRKAALRTSLLRIDITGADKHAHREIFRIFSGNAEEQEHYATEQQRRYPCRPWMVKVIESKPAHQQPTANHSQQAPDHCLQAFLPWN